MDRVERIERAERVERVERVEGVERIEKVGSRKQRVQSWSRTRRQTGRELLNIFWIFWDGHIVFAPCPKNQGHQGGDFEN